MIAHDCFPPLGAVRVAADPVALHRWRRGRGRFDDPRGYFAVRYLAETLDGSLKETMPRPAVVSPDPPAPAEVTAEGAAEIDDDLDAFEVPAEPEYGPYDEIENWVRTRHVVRMRVVTATECADVRAASTFDVLVAAPPFRTVAGTPAVRQYLKERRRRTLRCADLADPDVPRPLTQMVSRVLFDDPRRFGGIVSQSCRDARETCWTVYGRTRVTYGEPVPLLTAEGGVDAVRRAAAFLEVGLPPWLR